MITIVDSGGANISSIQFALERLGVTAQLTYEADLIKESSHVILPGVGSAPAAMNYLKKYSLIEVLRSLIQPVLGICLGMQILFDFSDEGKVECLGLIPGKIKKLSGQNGLSIPHMGWNTSTLLQKNLLMNNLPSSVYAYFVHSYAAVVDEYTCAITTYGEPFSSVVHYKNFYGTQFHPERSSTMGMTLLKNFLEL